MARFGKEKDYSDKEDQLFSTIQQDASVVLSGVDEIPSIAIEFVKRQYARFGIPVPRDLEPLYELGLGIVIDNFNYYDPYTLFWEWSDVRINNDWCKYTYEIFDPSCRFTSFVEAIPECLETYEYIPGAAEAFFNEYIAKPGIKAMHTALTSSVIDYLNDFWQGDRNSPLLYCNPRLEIPELFYHEIEKFCATGMSSDRCLSIDYNKVNGYIDLSLWAGLLWLLGPMGRGFRATHSDLTDAALTYGEAIVYEGVVYPPTHYKKVFRAPQSCYKCGVDAWCVEMTLDSDMNTRRICEGCLSEGMLRLPHSTCGAKFCKYFECHHNSWKTHYGSMNAAMNQHGQLAQMARRQQQLEQAQPLKQLGGI